MDLELLLLSSLIGITLRIFLGQFPDLTKATPVFLGIWEGTALYQQLRCTNSQNIFIPYIFTLSNVAIDFILKENASRSFLILIWAMLSAMTSSTLSSGRWYGTKRKTLRRKTKRHAEKEKRVPPQRNHRRPSPRIIQNVESLTNVQIAPYVPVEHRHQKAPVQKERQPSALHGLDVHDSVLPEGPVNDLDDLDISEDSEDDTEAAQFPAVGRANIHPSTRNIPYLPPINTSSPLSPELDQEGDDQDGHSPSIEGWVEISQSAVHEIPSSPRFQRTLSSNTNPAIDCLSTIPEELSEEDMYNRSPTSMALQVDRPVGPVPDDQSSSRSSGSRTVLASPLALGTRFGFFPDWQDPLATPASSLDLDLDPLTTPILNSQRYFELESEN